MKIVFLAPFGIRPKGTLIARMLPLADELQRLGHTVTIIAPPYTNPEDSGKVETVRGVTIRNIELCGGGLMAPPRLAWRMYRAALAEQPDIVHLFKPKGYGGLAAMFLAQFRRMGIRQPLLFVDMDDWEGRGGMNDLHPYSPTEKALFQFQEDWLPLQARGVTVASRTLQTKAWGMGLPRQRVLYLPNCVEDIPPGDGTGVRQRLGIPADVPVLLLYTRFFDFSQDKLHFVFAEIFRQVPEVRFLVVGKGRNNEEQLLLAKGEELGFAPALVMGGWLEPEDIPSYLAAADVAIYPFSDNLISRSKCPAKLTEILRAGVAVVADAVGQLAEYVKPGVSGVLCNPDDWQEMADRAAGLLLDVKLSRETGATARRYLLEKFSWSDYAARLDQFYLKSSGAEQ
ncbi:glycosyltransferase family 4 protein [Geobacter pelophilus]|uniref:Glycosyltransferase family 4 protein n=1 Tax=Geoanaerobacter pelophilus TaxID=60036 RepID=A0AAW4LCM5_9BACT|nr:glycosyltransferase family 4 protein [Geoanaerobacter pelophilus]MBT0666310.1 glycosyltransferase family 4 protein [Geoanaerobacter pelophilus]